MKMFQLIVSSLLLLSCSSYELELDVAFGQVNDTLNPIEGTDTTGVVFPWAKSEGVRNVLRRATQMATLQWTPLNNVPWNRGVFLPESSVVGIPYSSTKQINKYVGLDVSIHTFMTAVHNPKSVLYTENLGKAPYYGTNCATYYGTVCSTCVDYALGIDIPYPSNSFPDLPDFDEVMIREISQLEPGDVLYRPGHVFMIYRVLTDSRGRVMSITYFEAASKICCLMTASLSAFTRKFNSEELRVFRYRKIDDVSEYEPSEYVAVGDEIPTDIHYNEALCPNRGDRAVYRIDEQVVINSFDSTYTELVVEGEEFFYSVTREDDMEIKDLSAGRYAAYLVDGERRSDSVEFIVADPQVSVQKDSRLHVEFSCAQGEPRYCVLCSDVGGFITIVDFTEEIVADGFVDVDIPDREEFYCKVVFKTPFGTVINNPIAVSR